MKEKSKNYKCINKIIYIFISIILISLMVLCLSSCKDNTPGSNSTTISKTPTESAATTASNTKSSTTSTTTTKATTTTTKVTTTTTANPYQSLQRLWISGNGYAKMNVYNIDSNGHLTGSLELSDEGQSIFFDLDVTPDYDGNYYQVLTANNTTVDFWFYFQSELSMVCTMNSQSGESMQFTMN